MNFREYSPNKIWEFTLTTVLMCRAACSATLCWSALASGAFRLQLCFFLYIFYLVQLMIVSSEWGNCAMKTLTISLARLFCVIKARERSAEYLSRCRWNAAMTFRVAWVHWLRALRRREMTQINSFVLLVSFIRKYLPFFFFIISARLLLLIDKAI